MMNLFPDILSPYPYEDMTLRGHEHGRDQPVYLVYRLQCLYSQRFLVPSSVHLGFEYPPLLNTRCYLRIRSLFFVELR